MTSLRRFVFWLHLACGLVAGVVIAIMSATGVAIAFEHEMLDWLDRDVARVTAPAGARPLPLAELQGFVAMQRPDFKTTAVSVPRDPTAAYTYRAGREETLYVNPYTGAAAAPKSDAAHHVIEDLIHWHRWLGAKDGATSAARLVTGVCNAAFLGLCVTGLYLWFPRKWSRRALRPLVWFVGAYRGKARDFNWHNVLGLWSAPVLIVLAGTGVVISFGWAHDLVFRAAGEAPPKFRDFRMMAVPAPAVPPVAPGTPRLSLDAIHARLLREFPTAESIAYTLPSDLHAVRPLDVAVFEPAPFSTAGRVIAHVDPFRGDVLSATRFSERSAGLQARVWVRFLHTGEAFGLAGKIVAALATAASLLLVWTGFALAWRRFFPRRNTPAPAR
jgi:uncharacterized iron-regulated membrane protein